MPRSVACTDETDRVPLFRDAEQPKNVYSDGALSPHFLRSAPILQISRGISEIQPAARPTLITTATQIGRALSTSAVAKEQSSPCEGLSSQGGTRVLRAAVYLRPALLLVSRNHQDLIAGVCRLVKECIVTPVNLSSAS